MPSLPVGADPSTAPGSWWWTVASGALFLFSVFATYRFAHRLAIPGVRESHAWLATLGRSAVTAGLVGAYLAVPTPMVGVAALAALAITPTLVMQRVFATDVETATRLSLRVFATEAAAGAALLGGVLVLGGYLDGQPALSSLPALFAALR